MKVTRQITIDSEVLLKAKMKTNNVSGTINELLRNWVETSADEAVRTEKEKIKSELELLKVEMAKKQKEIDDMKKKEEDRKPVLVLGGEGKYAVHSRFKR